ncbi:MAG: hypothetical protein LBR32_00400 [Propionibacteriaceae bacterium]|nr:hypothetical protein [Propionibacteriaceae bacterium]
MSSNPQSFIETKATEKAAMPSNWNDRISYVYVPYCSKVTIFQDGGFGGNAITLTTGVHNLPNYRLWGSTSWNDAISSYRILRDASKSGC